MKRSGIRRVAAHLLRLVAVPSIDQARTPHGKPWQAAIVTRRSPAKPTRSPCGPASAVTRPERRSSRRVWQASGSHDWTASQRPSADAARFVDHTRSSPAARRASASGASRIGRLWPSTATCQVPRSDREPRATRWAMNPQIGRAHV